MPLRRFTNTLGIRSPVRFLDLSAVPVNPVLDTFDRANNNDLGANWTEGYLDTGNGLQIYGGELRYNVTSGDAYWNGQTFGPDCEAYISNHSTGQQGDKTLAVRLANIGAGTTDGYEITLNSAGSWVEFHRIDNGVVTWLGSESDYSFITGAEWDDAGLLRVVGSTLTAYIKKDGAWYVVDSRTDTTYTSAGHIGVGQSGNRCPLDDFGGGTI